MRSSRLVRTRSSPEWTSRKSSGGEDTFVDFEHGINFSIKQIRDALGDDAEKPRFIETVPRTGYRFIAPIDHQSTEPPRASYRRWLAVGSVVGLLAILGLLASLRPSGPPPDPRVPRYPLSLPRDVRIPLINYTVLAISPDWKKDRLRGL